jgi:2,3-bisphosphoglycerate-independent phosphoglycerate mutase
MNDRKDKELLAILYETAGNAGIEVIEDKLNRRGGICSVDGRIHVIFDEKAPVREKNRLILDAISRTDIDSFYMPPKVREVLGRQEQVFMLQKQDAKDKTSEADIFESVPEDENEGTIP